MGCCRRPRSPKLAQALRKADKDGLTHLVPDGTLVHTDRVRADRPYFPASIGARDERAGDRRSGREDPVDLGCVARKIHDLTAARV